jgi:hypothetical protein
LTVEEIEDGDFHHTLIVIGRFILDDFHCNELPSLEVLALDYLAKSSLAENIQNQIPLAFFLAQNIIDIEDVVALFIVIAIILDPLARLGQNPPRILRGLILEIGVADTVSPRKMNCQCLQRRNESTVFRIGSPIERSRVGRGL